jgi:hypothetical protein
MPALLREAAGESPLLTKHQAKNHKSCKRGFRNALQSFWMAGKKK